MSIITLRSRHASWQLPFAGAALGSAFLWPQLATGIAQESMAQQPQGRQGLLEVLVVPPKLQPQTLGVGRCVGY